MSEARWGRVFQAGPTHVWPRCICAIGQEEPRNVRRLGVAAPQQSQRVQGAFTAIPAGCRVNVGVRPGAGSRHPTSPSTHEFPSAHKGETEKSLLSSGPLLIDGIKSTKPGPV